MMMVSLVLLKYFDKIYFQQTYQEFLREKKSLRKQNTQCAQLAIINKEIKEVKALLLKALK